MPRAVEGKSITKMRLSVALKKSSKIQAVVEGITLEQLIEKAIQHYLTNCRESV